MSHRRDYTTVDKTDWLRGPWDDEPDKIQWIDETTGLDCLIVRNGSGALCGYVGVPPEHPWHGLDYSGHLDVPCEDRERGECWWEDGHSPESTLKVHGGLTYSDTCQPSDDESRGVCHVPDPGRPENVWWFGFDCAHAWDLSPAYAGRYARILEDETYKPVAYVEQECASLARQLVAVAP